MERGFVIIGRSDGLLGFVERCAFEVGGVGGDAGGYGSGNVGCTPDRHVQRAMWSLQLHDAAAAIAAIGRISTSRATRWCGIGVGRGIRMSGLGRPRWSLEGQGWFNVGVDARHMRRGRCKESCIFRSKCKLSPRFMQVGQRWELSGAKVREGIRWEWAAWSSSMVESVHVLI
eukprot:1147913-Pelagomonas_calceolata.AAC.6